MSWTYELMCLPARYAGSYVLVTSRGASVAVRIYTDAKAPPHRIDGKELPGLPELHAEARAAGKPIYRETAEPTEHSSEWWARISRANRGAGLTPRVGPADLDRPRPMVAPPRTTETTGSLTTETVFLTHDRRPLRSMADWQALHPAQHWKAGYSAMELARAWHHARGFPPAVNEALAKGPFGALVVERGIAECLTAVPGAGRASHTDLMVEARGVGLKVVLGVEGKVHESFGPRVEAWLNKEEPGRSRSNKMVRLQGLCDGLGLQPTGPAVLLLRYQLLHRSWAALSHARETDAQAAVLVVHALGDGEDADNLVDYRAFLRALGAGEVDAHNLVSLGTRGGMPFWAVWVRDRPLPR